MEKLQKLWNDPSGAYKSIAALRRESGVQLDKVREFVAAQKSTRTHRVGPTGSYHPNYFGEQYHIDIAFFSRKAHLVAVDAFSGKMYVRPLTNKSAANIIKAMDEICEVDGCPDSVFADGESGIASTQFTKWAEDNDVQVIQTRGHAVRAERGILTIKQRIARIQADTGGVGANLVPGIVHAYNSKHIHERHGLTPNDASKPANKKRVLEADEGKQKTYSLLNVGDTVRIRVALKATDKPATAARWGDVKIIEEMKPGVGGNMYRIGRTWYLRKDLKPDKADATIERIPVAQLTEKAPIVPRAPSGRVRKAPEKLDL